MKDNEFTLKQIFSIVDGRLSTCMDDVYKILNLASGRSLQTLELGHVADFLKDNQPRWYSSALIDLNLIKSYIGNDFDDLMKYLDDFEKTYFIEESEVSIL